MPSTLRVISRPSTVPAERMKLLNAGLAITLSTVDGSGFAAAFDAERVGRAGGAERVEMDVRHVIGARHAVVHERASDELGVVRIDDILE